MKRILLMLVTVILAATIGLNQALAQSTKPNILIIWGDDVGMWNISAYPS
jgi:arylsulfatase